MTHVVRGVSRVAVEFDFDIAWDAFEKDDDALPFEATIRRIAKKHGVDVVGIDYHGPGGGNPNVRATAPDKATAREFLIELYGAKNRQEAEDWVDPILAQVP